MRRLRDVLTAVARLIFGKSRVDRNSDITSNVTDTRLNNNIILAVERLQAWAFGRFGRNPILIPREIDQMASRRPTDEQRLLVNHENVPEMLKEMPLIDESERAFVDECYKKWRSTQYQDPLILNPMAGPFEIARDMVASIFKQEVVLASIPVHIPNAFVVEVDGPPRKQYAIVVQEAFRELPYLLANVTIDYIPHAPDEIFDHRRVSVAFQGDDLSKLKANMVAVFVIDAVHDDSVLFPGAKWKEFKQGPNSDQYSAFHFGFMFFIFAHEFAHLARRHFDQLRGEKQDPWERYPEELSQAFRQITDMGLKLPDSSSPSDRAKITRFMKLHMMELQADFEAMQLLILACSGENFTLNRNKLTYIISGALSFVWYLEISERVQRTIRFGDSWFNNKLYTEYYLAESLLFRSTHPTPGERRQRTKFLINNALGSKPEYGELISIYHKCDALLETFFEGAWSGEGIHSLKRVALKWHKEGAMISGKWVQAIPKVGLALGIDQE